MISEFMLVVSLIASIHANTMQNSSHDPFDNAVEIEELRTPYSSTFQTSYGTYITCYSSSDNSLKEEQDRYNGSYQDIIQNKYYIIGSSNTYSGNTLKVGKDPLVNGNGTNDVYHTAVCISLYSLPDNSYVIANAGFRFHKESGSLNYMTCCQITTPNLYFSYINGNTNYSSVYVDSCYASQQGSSYFFDFDVTSPIVDARNSNSQFINLVFQGTSDFKTANLYSNSSSYKPFFYIEYYSRYGNARPYMFVDQTSNMNCHGYVRYMQFIDQNSLFPLNVNNCNLSSSMNPVIQQAFGNLHVTYNLMQNTIFPVLCPFFNPNHLRIINSYNGYINANERRIAFRVKVDSYNRYSGYYHFIAECDDGTWACKFGSGPTDHTSSSGDPSNDSTIWYQGSAAMDSPILYMAYIEDAMPPGGVYSGSLS